MIIKTSKKYYEVKFGLHGLILIKENLNLLEEQDIRFILYCGLISHYPNITFSEIDFIIKEADNKQLLEKLLYEIPQSLLSLHRIEGLYSKAVGEIGIAPTEFYKMTPEEIELAYEGYLERKEMEANLNKLAVSYALKNKKDLIYLKEDKGYSQGSLEEREQVFDTLRINEG